MQGIIRQPPAAAALPDLRNLGTILRVLLAVNGATLLVALAREPRLWALPGEWATLTAFVEPHLFAELALLWLLQPLLVRARPAVAIGMSGPPSRSYTTPVATIVSASAARLKIVRYSG